MWNQRSSTVSPLVPRPPQRRVQDRLGALDAQLGIRGVVERVAKQLEPGLTVRARRPDCVNQPVDQVSVAAARFADSVRSLDPRLPRACEHHRIDAARDQDGDGDIDVLSASQDDTIAWYESDGGLPPSFTERVISTTADTAASVFAIDLDGDGDIDALSASRDDDTIAWYENTNPVPTVSEWGLIAMLGTLLAAGRFVIKKRRLAS